MHQPPGFTNSAHSDYVCLLQKSLYGLKQALKLGFSDFPAMLFEPISITAKLTRLFSSFTRGQTRLTYSCMWMISFLQLLLLRSCNTKYATEILERAHMLNCNPCKTPVDTEKKLGHEGSPVTDPTLYRSLSEALQFLTFTRPDLSYAVNSCPATRRSTFRYCVFLGDNLLTWYSKRQDTLSRSSDEAEYCGVANAVAETSWIRNLFRELHIPLFIATLVYCDNVSAIYMSVNPVQHQRTKHIEIDIHFVRDKVAAGHVRVLHVPSRFQYADIFTKGLPYPLFTEFRSSLSVRKSPALTAERIKVHIVYLV
nr:hypothetical protein [Tanacetum cinerariifolium]